MSLPPPDGLRLRPATVADAPAIDELITAADVAVQGWSESSVPELLGWWRLMDLEHSSWVLHDEESIVAYRIASRRLSNVSPYFRVWMIDEWRYRLCGMTVAPRMPIAM